MRRRERFRDLIERQFDLFELDQAELLRRCEEAERAYDAGSREEAEERFGDYQDLVEEATEALEDMRDAYASTLEDTRAYLREFEQAAARRLPRLRPQEGH